MPWLLLKARKTNFFGDRWQECQANGTAPSELVKAHDLSVWLIDDGESNLDRVVTALASACDVLQDLSYVMVSQEVVETLGISIVHTQGNTPDEEANDWHRDLSGLPADPKDTKLFGLASAISREHKFGKRSKAQLRKLIEDGIEAGHIDTSKVSERILAKLNRTV